ncbi:hypothetical protein F4804DRAFT_234985 [Jackrogersella minutella]|nr:hypothetical protein F4804DRAFT_234985 [Jackrogersella minutella]
MRSLVLAALPRARSSKTAATATSTLQSWATRRTFSSLPSLRPTLLASSSTNSTVFRPSTLSTGLLNSYTPSAATGVLDLVPSTAVSAHPALAGGASQVRFGPRPTVARTSRLVRKRRHGFLSRIRTHNGRKTLQRRRDKKRSILSN